MPVRRLRNKWSHEMRLSRLGILVIISFIVLTGANCSYYNRIIARKNLVDGATAYKERKFAQAEERFRRAVAIDPDGKTLEGKTAQLFLARTLHSEFIANRKDTAKGEEAIEQYKKTLASDVNEQSAFKAIANLQETLGRPEEAMKWITERSENTSVKPEYRAEAFTSLAAKQYSCANDISDIEPVKKTVKKDGKDVFQYTKPEKQEDYDKLVGCANKGMELIDKAIDLEKQAGIETDSVWSYKANLLIQKMRIAEMDGNNADKDRFKAEADKAKEKFTTLAAERKRKEEEAEAKKKAEEDAANKKK
jgi:tetratricopeptide (TPR) repeat protein